MIPCPIIGCTAFLPDVNMAEHLLTHDKLALVSLWSQVVVLENQLANATYEIRRLKGLFDAGA